MIDRLRSHLRSEKGFTLIELLVVIAIIAILVVIVVVAINPAERLREASDRRAAANVRSAGSLITTCITKQIELTVADATIYSASGGAGSCTGSTGSALSTYGTPPPITGGGAVTIDGNGTDNACAFAQGRSGSFWIFNSNTGAVTTANAALGADCAVI